MTNQYDIRLQFDPRLARPVNDEDDDDNVRRDRRILTNRVSGTPTKLQVSKFLQYDVLAPPDADVNASKFIQYDVLAPPDADVSISKTIQYVVLETVQPIYRNQMLEYETRILAPWAEIDFQDAYAAQQRLIQLRRFEPTVATNANINLTGIFGTGIAGSVISEINTNLSGVFGTGAVGSLAATNNPFLIGVFGTGAIGNIGISIAAALTGVIGSGHAGTVIPSVETILTGVHASGAVGTIGIDITDNPVLIGIFGTGAIGGIQVSLKPSHALSGLFAVGAVGTITAHPDIDRLNIPLAGLFGTGAIGEIGFGNTIQLTGVYGTGAVGSLSLVAIIDGLTMTELSGSTLPESNGDIYFSVRWSDDGGQTWSNPQILSLGGTGHYMLFPTLKNLGMGRDRVFEISVSAPVATALSNIFIETDIASS